MAEGMKETFNELLQSVKEALGKLATVYTDRSDREKRNILLIAGGSLVALILIVVLLRVLFPPELAVRVAANTAGVLGENFIAVENREQEPIVDLVIVVDERYIYDQKQAGDRLPVGEVLTIKLPSFTAIKGGQPAAADYKPKIAILECDQGSIDIDFSEQ